VRGCVSRGDGRGSTKDDCPKTAKRFPPTAIVTRQTARMSVAAETIYSRVRRVPPGYVTTYGDLSPGSPRHAGRVLSQEARDVPWWRVVRADGSLAKGSEQRRRLIDEDVPILGDRVVMAEARIPPEAIF
jgi:methylated-DNA-protein-cysteine methyltransferase related protein